MATCFKRIAVFYESTQATVEAGLIEATFKDLALSSKWIYVKGRLFDKYANFHFFPLIQRCRVASVSLLFVAVPSCYPHYVLILSRGYISSGVHFVCL